MFLEHLNIVWPITYTNVLDKQEVITFNVQTFFGENVPATKCESVLPLAINMADATADVTGARHAVEFQVAMVRVCGNYLARRKVSVGELSQVTVWLHSFA